MSEFDYTGIPKIDSAPDEKPLDYSGIPREDGFDYSGISDEDKTIFSIGKTITGSLKEAGKGILSGTEDIFSKAGGLLDVLGKNVVVPEDRKKELEEQGTPQEFFDKRKKIGETISLWGKTAKDFWAKAQTEGIEAPTPEVYQGSFMQNPSWERAAGIIGQSVPSLGAATIMSMATGSPVIGASFLGMIEAEPIHSGALAKGKSLQEANTFFGLSSVGTSILEILPITHFMRGGEGKFIKDAFKGAIQEGSEEVLQGIWNNAIEKYGFNETKKLTEGLVESLIAGAGSGGVMGALTSGRGIDSQIKEAVDKGVPKEDIDKMTEALGNQIADNADKVEEKLTESASQQQAKTKTEMINDLKGIILNAEPNQVIKTEEGYKRLAGGFVGFLGNKGHTSKELINIFNKALNNEKLTPNQQEKLDSILTDYSNAINKSDEEIRAAYSDLTELRKMYPEITDSDIIKIEQELEKEDLWDDERLQRAIEIYTKAETPSREGPTGTPTQEATHQDHLEEISQFEHQTFTDRFGKYLKSEGGFVDIPTDAINKNVNTFKDMLGKEFIRYYGLTPEARQAFVKLTESKEIRQDEIVDFVSKQIRLSDEDAEYLTLHIENPQKYPIQPNLKAQADAVNNIFNSIFDELKKRKLLSEKFPQTFIDQANKNIEKEKAVIETLKTEEAKERHRKNIKELENRIEYLKTLGYVPHRYKPMLESIAVNLFKQGRLSEKISSAVTKIKGRKIATLEEAEAKGLIPVKDIRILTGAYMDYALNKIAVYDFIEKLKTNGDIVQKDSTAPDDWEKVMISQLDGYKVHPYLANALENYAFQTPKKSLLGRGYDAVNRLAKTILFYNPFIMTINDLAQSYMAGSLNIQFRKNAWESVRDFTTKSDFYKAAIEGGLFSTPYDVRPAIEEQIQVALDEMGKKEVWLKQLINKANPPAVYDQISKITWSLDRIWRLSNVKHFMQKGMSMQEAINRTNLYLVDYSFIPDRLRQNLNRIFLTPTYRSQMWRLYYNFLRHPVKNAGAIARIVGFHVAVALFANMAGYKRENLYRFVKKLKEPIIQSDGTALTERVVLGSSPLFEMHKLFGRAFSRSLYLNLARVPYIGWSIAKNRDWTGNPVYDPALPLDDKSLQILSYVLKSYVAPVDAFLRLGNEEQDAIEKVLNFMAIPIYKRQDSIHYYMGQVRRITGDLKDYRRRHPDVSPEKWQEIVNEGQRRIDNILRKIERMEEK